MIGLLVVGGLGVVVVVGVLAVIVAVVVASSSAVEASVPSDAWYDECYAEDDSQQPVDCRGPHSFEVYSAVLFPDDLGYPSRVDRLVGLDLCEEDFEAYTGDRYLDLTGDYDYAVRYPSRSEWEDDGDRIALCVLHHVELDEFRGRAGTPLP
ncbi:MAG: septum formation family protein [Actinomycetota bacterium]